jgi:hypothetical protein
MISSPTKISSSAIIRVFRTLVYARSKLLNRNIPMQLRAVSYLRISCSALQKLQDLGVGLPIKTTSIRFSFLLNLLTEYDPCWWDKCTVSCQGILKSENSVIQDLLESPTQLHKVVVAPHGFSSLLITSSSWSIL